MLFAFIVWLVMTAIPTLHVIGIITCIGFAIAIFATTAYGADEDDFSYLKNVCKHLKWGIPLVLAIALLPGERTSWFMVGAYATQTIAQSDVAQELGQDSVDVMKALLAKAKQEIGDVDVKEIAKEAVKEVKEGQK